MPDDDPRPMRFLVGSGSIEEYVAFAKQQELQEASGDDDAEERVDNDKS